jgi:hypothetical protein
MFLKFKQHKKKSRIFSTENRPSKKNIKLKKKNRVEKRILKKKKINKKKITDSTLKIPPFYYICLDIARLYVGLIGFLILK